MFDFEEYYPKIYNYIYYRVLHKETAEDLTSDVFYRALAYAASFDERKASYKTWLFTIAHNIVANYYRSNKNTLAIEDFDTPAAENSIEEAIDTSEDFRRLFNLLKTLPEREREVIALRFWGEMTHKEIATRIGMREKSVSSMMSRLIRKLRALWI
ncbi:MAG: sigma-70 family RNA polymerase sigma factor [Oscillospiraceae bacterium]|nr:sigma-70 family RNA polymerase sigma factor [Oscillospiraceae bacterium]